MGIGYSTQTKLFCNNQFRLLAPRIQSTGFIADAAGVVFDSVVSIAVRSDSSNLFSSGINVYGSGFFIDSDGTILTNAHVVSDAGLDSKIFVRISDGREYEAYVHALDAHADLAIVKIYGKGQFKPVVFGSIDYLRPGDWVVAIGCPYGLRNSVTAGVLSSLLRQSNDFGGQGDSLYLQSDCAIHVGSSGGPLVNLDGQVIGINTSRSEREGISFSIRVDTAMAMIRQLIHQGRVTRPYLGISTTTLSAGVWKQLTETGQHIVPPVSSGVLITKVTEHSPAAKCGLQVGDVIVGVASTPISSTQELLKTIGLTIGKPIQLNIKRSLPLDVDWDGRVNRYEVIETNLNLIPGELDVFESRQTGV
jgi:HtrA serine peptidase 2